MVTTQTQIRRGTSAQCAAMTPASSEVIHDTTNNRLRAGNGVRAGGYEIPNFFDIQNCSFFRASSVGGSANAITLTFTPATLSDTGLSGGFVATATNTGATTFAVDGRSAASAKKIQGGSIVDLAAGDIINGGYYEFARVGSIYLVTSGIIPVQDTAGLKLLAVVSGGGSSYDFTSQITSAYKAYRLVIESLLLSANNTDLNMRTGAGSFATANYTHTTVNQLDSTQTPASSNDGASSWPISLNIAGNGDNGYLHGIVDLFGFGNTTGWRCIAQWQTSRTQSDNVSAGNNKIRTSRGSGFRRDTSNVFDRIQIFPSSGSISSGNAYLYGYRPSL